MMYECVNSSTLRIYAHVFSSASSLQLENIPSLLICLAHSYATYCSDIGSSFLTCIAYTIDHHHHHELDSQIMYVKQIGYVSTI